MNESPRHAIVYGASGLIGWSVVDEFLKSYTDLDSFGMITGVTDRKIELSEAWWPEAAQRTLNLVSGIDLRCGDGVTLVDSLKRSVTGIETVTHIFYLVFTAVADDIEEVATNKRMFQNVIDAHSSVSPNLQFVAFPGGTRGYGIYTAGGTFASPLSEEMVDNLPADYAKTVVYPVYREILRSASEGKTWTWCEVCSDAIVGFTPNGSQFSLALHWAQYLSLYAYNHGIGPYTQSTVAEPAQVPFPGNIASANSLLSPVSASTIARFMIFASLHPRTCGDGQLFNIADHEEPCTYGDIWPQLAKWFGLDGTGLAENSHTDVLKAGELPGAIHSLTPGQYVARYKGVFAKCGRTKAVEAGVGAGSHQLDSVGYWLTFDRQMTLKRLRNTGFEGNKDPIEGWLQTFEMFRRAGVIL